MACESRKNVFGDVVTLVYFETRYVICVLRPRPLLKSSHRRLHGGPGNVPVCYRNIEAHCTRCPYSTFHHSVAQEGRADNHAPQYPLCYPSWCDFIPKLPYKEVSRIRHYSTDIIVAAPAPAAPAILAYLTLANKLTVSWEALNYVKPLAPTVASLVPTRSSTEWEGEWVRTLSVADPKVVMGNTPSGAFRPGSLQGVWEGLFTVRCILWHMHHPREGLLTSEDL